MSPSLGSIHPYFPVFWSPFSVCCLNGNESNLSSAMLSTTALLGARATSALALRRTLALSAASQQQAAKDPIQQLFVDKVREYADKKTKSGGKLVDADAGTESALKKELEKVRYEDICLLAGQKGHGACFAIPGKCTVLAWSSVPAIAANGYS